MKAVLAPPSHALTSAAAECVRGPGCEEWALAEEDMYFHLSADITQMVLAPAPAGRHASATV